MSTDAAVQAAKRSGDTQALRQVRECEHIPGDVRAILWRCYHALAGSDLGILRTEVFAMVTSYGTESRAKPCSNDVVGCKRWRGHEGPCA